ncbi:MAG: EspA/EspE family type VII secretion system effector [Actinomycetota bacterium]|nr:EspA/EspE family type VII secretion system effector [Actinomycetota bacterium]
MGLFDIYSDMMRSIGDTMQGADPVGPVGAAGSMLSALFGEAGVFDQGRAGELGPLAADTAEVASVAQAMLPRARQTPIIAGGLQAVLAMQYLCGWTNEPSDGEGYSASAQRFNEVIDTLKSAMPEQHWAGEASDAYRRANEHHCRLAETMVDADLDVHAALSAEAGEVNNTRRILNNAATLMGNAIAPALVVQAIPEVGMGMSRAIESAVVGVSLPTCLWYMEQLSEQSMRAAESIRNATLLYEEIADGQYSTRM